MLRSSSARSFTLPHGRIQRTRLLSRRWSGLSGRVELCEYNLRSWTRPIFSGISRKWVRSLLYPPNVGGWPSGQAWLSSAALQYKFEVAQMIVAAGDLSPLSVPASKRVQACANWLGIPEWSRRTGTTLAAGVGFVGVRGGGAVLS